MCAFVAFAGEFFERPLESQPGLVVDAGSHGFGVAEASLRRMTAGTTGSPQ